ncbi:MAG: hypothetical protein HQ465_09095, partial [Rhodospirillales bacterium]|nr:hypothetical protein [Rhodospirillales bacterium]
VRQPVDAAFGTNVQTRLRGLRLRSYRQRYNGGGRQKSLLHEFFPSFLKLTD